MAKRNNRSDPNSTTLLKGNLMIPAAIHDMENGKGSKAPTTIKKPPHFLEFLSCLAILTVIYVCTAGILVMAMPIQYDRSPPKYDKTPKILKKSQGMCVLADQAIKISGGTKPSKVSEIKNTLKTPQIGRVSVIRTNKSFILKKWLKT